MAIPGFSLGRDQLTQLAQPLAAFLVTLVVLWIVRRIVLRFLSRGAAKPESFAHVFVRTIRTPSILWIIASALYLSLESSIIPQKYTGRAAQAIAAFLVISFSMVAASVLIRMLTVVSARRTVALQVSGLSRTLILVVVYSIGALLLLRVYNVNITPMLTALGVGGLAVALALQDTLANFFAGIHILIEEPIAVGQAIRLTEQEEGIVTDIGWRTTRLRNWKNNIVVIPNTKITSGILTNYNLPEQRVGTGVDVLVGHDADVDEAIRLAVESVASMPGVLAEPAAKAIFSPGLLPTHIQFSVVFSVSDITLQAATQSEARLRILQRLREAGVPPPRVEIR